VWVAAQGNTGVDPYLDNGTNWTLFAEGFNYAGAWSAVTPYNYFDVVTLNNSFYLSIVPGSQTNTGNNPQTDNGTHWALLDQGFNFRGVWSNLTTYQPYDVVTYLSSTYVGLTTNNIGNTPATSPANWTLMAAAGQIAPRMTFTFNMPSAVITQVQITGNVLTLTAANTFNAQNFGTGQGQLNTFYLTGLTTATFLNGQVITATSVSGTTLVAGFTHGNYGPTADTGNATMSIPNNGTYWTTIQLAPTFALSYVQCAQPTRIELYSTTAARTADASRPATVQPTLFTQHGVITDLNLDGVVASFTSWVMSPLAYGANLDDPVTGAPTVTANIDAALTNISGGAPTTNGFSITFTFTSEETGGANTPNADEYVLGALDTVNLPSAVANPTAYFGVDTAPATAGSLDDEFPGTSLNTATRWTQVQFTGTASATVSKSILSLQADDATGATAVILQTAPAAPWTVVAKTTFSSQAIASGSNFRIGGISVFDNSGSFTTSKVILFSMKSAPGAGGSTPTGFYFGQDNFTNISVYSSTPNTVNPPNGTIPNTIWLQLANDGTNFHFSYSTDGINYIQLWAYGVTAFLANASFVGLHVAGNQTAPTIFSFDYFRRTV
jgi:hypothetical protein